MERNISGRPAPDQLKGQDLDLRKRSRKIRIQAMVSPEIAKRLQQTAIEFDTSVSEVACQIISKYYES